VLPVVEDAGHEVVKVTLVPDPLGAQEPPSVHDVPLIVMDEFARSAFVTRPTAVRAPVNVGLAMVGELAPTSAPVPSRAVVRPVATFEPSPVKVDAAAGTVPEPPSEIETPLTVSDELARSAFVTRPVAVSEPVIVGPASVTPLVPASAPVPFSAAASAVAMFAPSPVTPVATGTVIVPVPPRAMVVPLTVRVAAIWPAKPPLSTSTSPFVNPVIVVEPSTMLDAAEIVQVDPSVQFWPLTVVLALAKSEFVTSPGAVKLVETVGETSAAPVIVGAVARTTLPLPVVASSPSTPALLDSMSPFVPPMIGVVPTTRLLDPPPQIGDGEERPSCGADAMGARGRPRQYASSRSSRLARARAERARAKAPRR
jgi:hypothetical protein